MDFETLTNKFPEIGKFPRQMFESIMEHLDLEFPNNQVVWDNFVFVNPNTKSEEYTTRVRATSKVMIFVDNGKDIQTYTPSDLISTLGEFNLQVLHFDEEIIMAYNNATKRHEMLKAMQPDFEKGHILVTKQRVFSYTVE